MPEYMLVANNYLSLAILFEPQDLWVGVYWKSTWEGGTRFLILWICFVPMPPLRLAFRTYN